MIFGRISSIETVMMMLVPKLKVMFIMGQVITMPFGMVQI